MLRFIKSSHYILFCRNNVKFMSLAMIFGALQVNKREYSEQEDGWSLTESMVIQLLNYGEMGIPLSLCRQSGTV